MLVSIAARNRGRVAAEAEPSGKPSDHARE
jgi:hypothetical protein